MGDGFAHDFGRGDIATALESLFGFRIGGTGGNEGLAGAVVDHLGVDVADGAENAQTGALGGALDGHAHALVHAAARRAARQSANWNRCHGNLSFRYRIIRLCRSGLGARLARFLLETLAGDTDTFLLIGVGRTKRTNIRRDLADLSFIRAADDDMGLLVDSDLNALGNRKFDGMGLAKGKSNRFALEFGAVADANDIEFLLETFGDALYGVGHQGAGQPVDGAMLLVFALGEEHTVFLLELDAARQADGELALGTLDIDFVGGQSDLDRGRHGNWFVTDTRHRYAFLN